MDSRHQAWSDCWKKTCTSDLSVQRGTKATIDNCFPCYKAKLSVCLNWLHCFLLYNCALRHKRVTRDTPKWHLNQIPSIFFFFMFLIVLHTCVFCMWTHGCCLYQLSFHLVCFSNWKSKIMPAIQYFTSKQANCVLMKWKLISAVG